MCMVILIFIVISDLGFRRKTNCFITKTNKVVRKGKLMPI